jgi:hypothetical protein
MLNHSKPGRTVESLADARPEHAERALHALSGGVTGYIYGQVNPADRRAAVIQMSFLLRRAFSVRDTDLDALPVQLGVNFDAARTYIAAQASIWAHADDFAALFLAAKITDAHAKAIRVHLPSLIPLDHGAIWLSREFGHVRAAREAEHARRYVAAWLSRAIIGESGRPAPIGKPGAEALQGLLDGWSNPVAGIETTLHFERVIQPMLARIAELARLAAPNGAANDPGART